jgi:replication-associated recombination protein RarA
MDDSQQQFPWPTVGGYDLYEAMSVLQKSVRRGLEDDALFWASELYLSRYENHAWSRLLVIASEDVGLADSQTFLLVSALHQEWNRVKKTSEAKLHFIHAVLFLVRAPKSRIVDHATIKFFKGPRAKRAIPDWALDKHTPKGRAMGRGYQHFFDEGAKLENVILADPYAKEAKELLSDRNPTR